MSLCILICLVGEDVPFPLPEEMGDSSVMSNKVNGSGGAVVVNGGDRSADSLQILKDVCPHGQVNCLVWED